MSLEGKEVPHDLRNLLQSGYGDRAAGGSRIAPIAGPSHSNSNAFRSQADEATQQRHSQQRHYRQEQPLSDAYATFGSREVQAPFDRASTHASFSIPLPWSPDDLRPRPEDSEGVLAMLSSQSDEFDNEAMVHQEVRDRQNLPWHNNNDLRVPNDPVISNGSSNDDFAAGVHSREDYPYLFRMLSLPEDESLAAYLSENTYTDDVWSLPMDIKRDMDAVRSTETDSSTRAKALRRLEMLKGHLRRKDPAATLDSGQRVVMKADDWAWIWQQNNA